MNKNLLPIYYETLDDKRNAKESAERKAMDEAYSRPDPRKAARKTGGLPNPRRRKSTKRLEGD